MTKTQIQVPEELYSSIKAFARAREWSLAETFRRGAELLLEVYDSSPAPRACWVPPTSTQAGWQNLSPQELRDISFQDADPTLPNP